MPDSVQHPFFVIEDGAIKENIRYEKCMSSNVNGVALPKFPTGRKSTPVIEAGVVKNSSSVPSACMSSDAKGVALANIPTGRKSTPVTLQTTSIQEPHDMANDSQNRRKSHFKTPVVSGMLNPPVISAESERVFKSEMESSSRPPRPRRASTMENSEMEVKREKEKEKEMERDLFNRTWPVMKEVGWTVVWVDSPLVDRDLYLAPSDKRVGYSSSEGIENVDYFRSKDAIVRQMKVC